MGTLTSAELAQLHGKLIEEQARLRSDILDRVKVDDAASYEAIAGRVHDTGDESVAAMLTELDAKVTGMEIRQLREVELALKRLPLDEFGICESCEGEIGFARLMAQPTARMCIDCQGKHEDLRGARDGTPTL